MKKCYFLTLALICAITANAADLYIFGGFNGWNIASPQKFDFVDNEYKTTVDVSDNLYFAVSPRYADNSDWNWVNGERYSTGTNGYQLQEGVATTIKNAGDCSMQFPSAGTWDVVVNSNLNQITVKKSVVVVPQVDIVGGTVLYMKPNETWKQDNARFAAYFFNASGNAWASMTFVIDDTYSVIAPEGTWTNVIFCSMKGDNQTNDWSNKVQQTSDLKYDGENNLYDIATSSWGVAGDTVTGIEEVGVDAGAAAAVYYNLQGVKVANPENGIFIKKQGGRTSKVVL